MKLSLCWNMTVALCYENSFENLQLFQGCKYYWTALAFCGIECPPSSLNAMFIHTINIHFITLKFTFPCLLSATQTSFFSLQTVKQVGLNRGVIKGHPEMVLFKCFH